MPQQYKVPQNIDLEDKIVGPFTMKQFAYLMGGGLLIYAIYQVFLPYENNVIYTVIVALPVAFLALALTFIKINDRPFEKFIVNYFQFLFSPKRRIWSRGYETPMVVIKTPVKQKASTTAQEKKASLNDIATSLELSAGNTGSTSATSQGQTNQATPGVQGVTPSKITVGNQQQPEQTVPPQPPSILKNVFDIKH